MDINESLGTQPAKTIESRHCRSKPLKEPACSLIISLLLLHSNALNKIKENRAYLVIYFLHLRPTVKITSKKTILSLFSLSEFKLQNFWATLSGNFFLGWQGQVLVCLEENLGFLYVWQKNAMPAKPHVILLRHGAPSRRIISKHNSFENLF